MIDIDALSWQIKSQINDFSNNAPRSLQRSIGPSEVGGDCDRKLAYKIMGKESVNEPDKWLAQIGTWVHAGLAEMYSKINDPANPRYLVEERVTVTDTLSGSADLVDLENKLVIDWKVVGPTSLKQYRKDGPSDQYRVQSHLYAYGLINKHGIDITDVAIVFLPRGGFLKEMYVWSEPYNEDIALGGLARLSAVREIIEIAGEDSISSFPAMTQHCHFCPFFLPGSTDFTVGCPGGDIQPNNNIERR